MRPTKFCEPRLKIHIAESLPAVALVFQSELIDAFLWMLRLSLRDCPRQNRLHRGQTRIVGFPDYRQ